MSSKSSNREDRPVIRFRVQTGEGLYLDANCESSEEGYEFAILETPTIGESTRMEMLVHEYAGGIETFLDLQVGANKYREAAVVALSLEKGLPELKPDDRKGLAARAEELDREWMKWDHPLKRAADQLQNQIDRLWFLAQWKVCGVDMPSGWEDLTDHPQADRFYVAILASWIEAKGHRTPGKG